MHLFNSKLDDLILKVKKSQMERVEYEYISSFLGNKNFLVFGTGYDTEFWRFCNLKGFNIFLEHDSKWILKSNKDTFLIDYTCNILNYKNLLLQYKNNDYSNLKIDLPPIVYTTKWDVILVDGPPGNKKNSIGRMQSIFMAKFLSSKNTDILIHDCDREVENLYSKELFKIVKQLTKLRHCKNEI